MTTKVTVYLNEAAVSFFDFKWASPENVKAPFMRPPVGWSRSSRS